MIYDPRSVAGRSGVGALAGQYQPAGAISGNKGGIQDTFYHPKRSFAVIQVYNGRQCRPTGGWPGAGRPLPAGWTHGLS